LDVIVLHAELPDQSLIRAGDSGDAMLHAGRSFCREEVGIRTHVARFDRISGDMGYLKT
jgi:hypothetical protein